MRLLVREDGRINGAKFRLPDGGTRRISAGAVVLASGTLENTRLYAQALAHTGYRVTRWPGLNDHLPHGFIAPLPAALRRDWVAPERAFLWADHDARLRGNLFVDIHTARQPEPVLDLWWLAQQEEPFLDSILFVPEEEVWSARVEAGLRNLDSSAMERRDQYARGLLEALSLPEERVPADGPPDLYTAVDRAQATGRAVRYVNPLGHSDHEAGTIALGAHLAPGGRAPWADGLFVAGPATFPAPGAANPTLTMIALAAQTAAAIV
ncbi:GMC oxidoreductase [Streptomyces sp. NPDC001787]|uniref:GMC oxidoreductase n=1 Tax=Streptomyces sp. NPDC001787 TaxID=3154523 RepID=UPI0033222FDA